ncbi:MAG: hypothetical protein KBC06_01420 [Candidatus Pacebacteria bacterium]|nr:hypothetical protein [Candidatus Paceibacterota bacterium]
MSSNTLDKISFWALFSVIVLLPIFFIPFSKIPIENAKGLLLVVGLSVAIISWLSARLYDKKIVLPRSIVLISALVVVLVFLASSLFSKVPHVSLFGTLFDIGTFWFMLCCFLLMLLSSIVLKDFHKARLVLWGVVVSTSVALIFQILRIISPTVFSLGIFSSKIDNVFGSWNSLGLFFGFIIIISLFVIEFFPISKIKKIILSVLIVLSLLFVATVNFSLIWVMLGIFSLLLFIYKISFHSGLQQGTSGSTPFPVFSLAVVMVSLIFFVSGSFIGGYLPRYVNAVNTDITPSFGATFSIAKAVISHNPILGVGPNKFGEMWGLYKSINLNTSPFWNVYFQSGFGFFTTLLSLTGILGILSLLAFFVLFIKSGIQSVFSNRENQVNFELAVFFLATIYLFSASFFYSTGVAFISLAFVFAGIFIGLKSYAENRELTLEFSSNPKRSFVAIFIIVLMIILSAGFGLKYLERFASVNYFGRSLSSTTMPEAEAAIQKALALNTNDLYLRTYAQVYAIKFSSLANKNSALSDAEKADLQKSLDEAVSGAQLAVANNRQNYLNFQTLGYVYGTAGLFGVPDSYDKSVEAYSNASSLNPLNPELKLSLARVFLAQKKTKEARDYTTQALNLKPDYVDGFVLFAQISQSEGDIDQALFYAKRAQALAPDNKELSGYVDSLKKPTPPTTASKDDAKDVKKNGQ